jgi:hypothetical protein
MSKSLRIVRNTLHIKRNFAPQIIDFAQRPYGVVRAWM